MCAISKGDFVREPQMHYETLPSCLTGNASLTGTQQSWSSCGIRPRIDGGQRTIEAAFRDMCNNNFKVLGISRPRSNSVSNCPMFDFSEFPMQRYEEEFVPKITLWKRWIANFRCDQATCLILAVIVKLSTGSNFHTSISMSKQ